MVENITKIRYLLYIEFIFIGYDPIGYRYCDKNVVNSSLNFMWFNGELREYNGRITLLLTQDGEDLYDEVLHFNG